MAHAIELTIATGRTVFGGDPDSDERIQSREVRVSVTYRLEPGDQDVPLLAAVKAAEAERALDAAWQMAQRKRQEPCNANANLPSQATNGTTAPTPASESPRNGHRNARLGPNDGVASSSPVGHVTATDATTAPHAASTGSARTAGRAAATTPLSSVRIPGTREGVTAPQRLAIRSLCSRMEVAEIELRLLMDERFGKKELEGLTKEEAGTLLIALQRGEWEDAAARPEIARPSTASA